MQANQEKKDIRTSQFSTKYQANQKKVSYQV